MSQSPAPHINLLSKRKAKFDKQTKVAVKTKVWSGMVLVGYVAILVLVLIVAQVINWRVESTKKAINTAKLTLTSRIVLINQYEMLQSRVGIAKKLLAEKRESISLWQGVREILPEGVELSGFNLEASSLTLGFTAPHVVSANETHTMLETRLSELGVVEVKVGTSRSDDASYTLDASAILAGK